MLKRLAGLLQGLFGRKRPQIAADPSIDGFAEITQAVIRDEGFQEFLPTACFPTRRLMRSLAGVPAHVDVEEATTTWAARHAQPGESYMVAFKSSASTFKIIRIGGATREAREFTVE